MALCGPPAFSVLKNEGRANELCPGAVPGRPPGNAVTRPAVVNGPHALLTGSDAGFRCHGVRVRRERGADETSLPGVRRQESDEVARAGFSGGGRPQEPSATPGGRNTNRVRTVFLLFNTEKKRGPLRATEAWYQPTKRRRAVLSLIAVLKVRVARRDAFGYSFNTAGDRFGNRFRRTGRAKCADHCQPG